MKITLNTKAKDNHGCIYDVTIGTNKRYDGGPVARIEKTPGSWYLHTLMGIGVPTYDCAIDHGVRHYIAIDHGTNWYCTNIDAILAEVESLGFEFWFV